MLLQPVGNMLREARTSKQNRIGISYRPGQNRYIKLKSELHSPKLSTNSVRGLPLAENVRHQSPVMMAFALDL